MKEITIFYDFACPFCYVGFSILNRLRDQVELKVNLRPIILDKDQSLEGSDLSNYISELQIKAAYEQLEELGQEYGIEYRNKRHRYNTNRLHQAALYAHEQGSFYEFSQEAYKAIFTDNLNVGRKEVVDDLALRLGLDVEEMNREIDRDAYREVFLKAEEEGYAYEIPSVPSFVVDGQLRPVELKPYEEFKAILLGEEEGI